MRIGIDVTASIYTGGVGTYYRSLVPELLKLGKHHEFVTLGYAFRQYPRLTLANRKLLLPPRLMELVWNRLHVLPVELFIGSMDVFHAWDYLQPPARKARIVTTIHDLTAIKFPMYHHQSTVAAQAHRLRWVRKEAAAIITDSQATKVDIIELLKIDELKIHVIPLAAATRYHEFQNLDEKLRLAEIDRVKYKYRLVLPYLLAVGTLEPRKNLRRVRDAFIRLPVEKLGIAQLAIAGPIGWGLDLEAADNIILLGRVGEDDLPALYAGAETLIYPSLSEGFGLPVLEAMTVGCPVVTSQRGSLKEVAGAAAVLVDPESEEAIEMGIELALENKSKLRAAGLRQTARFSWQRAAQETLAVYEAMAE